MTYNFKEIGERMQEEREYKRLSLAYVAEFCGVQQYQTVSNWEKGNTNPSLKALLKLCELFECELGYLLGDDGYKLKTRAKTDIHKETGLSGEAVEKIVEENNTPEIKVLSMLLCNPDFWKVLRLIRQGIESAECSQNANATDEVIYRKVGNSESVVLKGRYILDYFRNSAINNFTIIVKDTVKPMEDGNEQEKR